MRINDKENFLSHWNEFVKKKFNLNLKGFKLHFHEVDEYFCIKTGIFDPINKIAHVENGLKKYGD